MLTLEQVKDRLNDLIKNNSTLLMKNRGDDPDWEHHIEGIIEGLEIAYELLIDMQGDEEEYE